MPNIGTLPTAGELLAESDVAGNYGQHLLWQKADDASVVLLTSATRIVLAQATATTATVDLRLVDVQSVPYVNAFIAHTGQRVEKYWRTKSYRMAGQPIPQPVVVAAPVAVPVAAPVAPTDVTGWPVAPTTPEEPEIETLTIPGVERPEKVKPKNAGKGYTKLGDIVVKDEDLRTLNDAWALRQTGVPAAVLITGPAGTAKTSLVRAFAASLGVEFLKIDGGAIRTADDWAGAFRQDPNTKVWNHRWSPFARVLQRGTPMVICVDEVNRTESPQALNALTGLLDWSGSLLVPDANATLTMPPGVLVIATANIGPEFVGTLPIDGAIRQRFPNGVRMDYPVESVEASLIADMTGVDKVIAERLVKLASGQRVNREDPQLYPSGAVISTRVLIDIARRIATCDTTPREAVWSTLRGQFDPGDEIALSVLVEAQFPEKVEAEGVDVIEEVGDEADQPTTIQCPSCGHQNPVGRASCDYCSYGLPQRPGLIQLQNTTY